MRYKRFIVSYVNLTETQIGWRSIRETQNKTRDGGQPSGIGTSNGVTIPFYYTIKGLHDTVSKDPVTQSWTTNQLVSHDCEIIRCKPI